MQLVVQSAGVADGLPVLVPSPQRRRRRFAVGAAGARPPRRALQALKREEERTLNQHHPAKRAVIFNGMYPLPYSCHRRKPIVRFNWIAISAG